MKAETVRTRLAVKVFLGILFIVLLTAYNSAYYSALRDFNSIHLKKLAMTNEMAAETDVTESDKANVTERTDNIHIAPLPKGFSVWSENCHMPSKDLFVSDIMNNYVENVGPICSTKEPLVTKSFDKLLNSNVLHINVNLKNQYLNASDPDDNINCCYRQVLRKDDNNIILMECKHFDQNFVVPNDIDYMLIECSGTKNTTIIFEDGLTFIQKRASLYERLLGNTQPRRPFGILMFGIDTISQYNVRRVMPRTFRYVQNNGWFELSGYNKVADNTFPNLMAVLSGADLDKVDEMCHYNEPGGLDNCSTLFNLFRHQGLVTAYSEDNCEISTFNYLKPGFVDPPTDYYQRPLLWAIQKRLPMQFMSQLAFCIGPRRYTEYIYDFGVEFAERYLGQSIFGLFWTNYAHNSWVDPATMDERIVEYFNYMESRHIFDNNVVILFSDHGSRFDFLRTLKEGYFEERLPMFFMRLPQWFQDQYPEMVKSLILNKNRLTSPYDLHVTLKHLAQMSLGKNEPIDLPLSCPTCQTLFKPVLENRTCQLAGIEDHWCTCTPFENIYWRDEEMKNLTQLVIDEMNIYLNESAYADKCVPLELNRVSESNLKLNLHHDVHTSRIQEYRMSFVTNPNEAKFDATFSYDTINKNITVDVIEISRLNRYAEDSACVDDNIVKKYCICKDSVKKIV